MGDFAGRSEMERYMQKRRRRRRRRRRFLMKKINLLKTALREKGSESLVS